MKANITLDVPTDVKLSIHGISNEHENICKNHNIANNYTGHRYSIQRNDTIILELTYGISLYKLGNISWKEKGSKLEKHYKVDNSINTYNW